MTLRITELEYRQLIARQTGKPLEQSIPINQGANPSKMRNVIEEADGIRFPSKKHRRHFMELTIMKKTGMIRYFLREVPFDLPGVYEDVRGRRRVARHFVDFAVCQLDGTFRYDEVKGRDLGTGHLKRVQVEKIYGIKINVI